MRKYIEIVADLEERILGGEIKPGQKLPSIRQLSETYQCSKSTIIRSFTDLQRRHLIYSVPQSGYYVVGRKEPASLADATSFVDFSSAAPDPSVFPYLDFQHCINKAVDTYQDDLFRYGTSQGLPTLLRLLQKQLQSYQVFTDIQHLCITSGVQQALAILGLMSFPNKKQIVLVEQPTYHLLIQLLEIHQIPTLTIKRTASGINFQELERLFQQEPIKFFYTMPRFHNPLGTSYSQKEKKQIAYLAQKYDVYIIEDDYLADLEHNTKADPIHTYAQSHVIYLKSYSKILFPGLRVGVAGIPEPLQEAFYAYKKLMDIDSSMLSQAALEIYVKSGMFDRHRQKIRLSYARRMEQVNKMFREWQQSHNVVEAPLNGGVHSYMKTKERISETKVKTNLLKRGIIIDTVDRYYMKDSEKELLWRINVSNVEEARIAKALGEIAEVLRL
ncbi:PLP-dependent aminotransferase family protein [Brevibacillus laterosporus]|uniref:aminotransferase-like domain-containing protein n=1 Tax=Brevibacillus laterosporus TaxID=1465 RepID=UPI000EB206DD|nr:PLP-dependent aminotransferase family protein [Brevibacillus laterosporus]AYK07946.1 PLP-dependent aminotransferase family protein [Brevibacillus laterosporus]